MLLLLGVHIVRNGIERSAGSSFQRFVLGNRESRVRAAGVGVLLAAALQSSAAVALLPAVFVHSGIVGLVCGIAMVLGADFGSALIVLALSFRLDWLVPFLLAVGGWGVALFRA